ncbi:lasso peptide biosynthesis B2 protein [uncultured Arcticibacterium sp.]|uniref:lasso peptide biosynthesis B2 protein n=1 Tax=uncultured Arcticibacterium sp. TaxID=2173042 RepID=UPI0030FCB79F
MLKKIGTFFECSNRKKILFIHACIVGYYAWLLDVFFQRRLRLGVESLNKISARNLPNYSSENSSQLVKDIGWSIKLAHKYILVNNACRHNAYQAKIMCKKYRLDSTIYVGAKINELGEAEAHAWTVVDDYMVTGFCQAEEYLVLNTFINEIK